MSAENCKHLNNLLCSLLKIDVNSRILPSDILQHKFFDQYKLKFQSLKVSDYFILALESKMIKYMD